MQIIYKMLLFFNDLQHTINKNRVLTTQAQVQDKPKSPPFLQLCYS